MKYQAGVLDELKKELNEIQEKLDYMLFEGYTEQEMQSIENRWNDLMDIIKEIEMSAK